MKLIDTSRCREVGSLLNCWECNFHPITVRNWLKSRVKEQKDRNTFELDVGRCFRRCWLVFGLTSNAAFDVQIHIKSLHWFRRFMQIVLTRESESERRSQFINVSLQCHHRSPIVLNSLSYSFCFSRSVSFFLPIPFIHILHTLFDFFFAFFQTHNEQIRYTCNVLCRLQLISLPK